MSRMKSNPAGDVVIAIPCLNEERYLASMLDDLLADSGAVGAKIAIVDGGSTDGSVVIAEAYAARHPDQIVLLKNPKRVQSAGVNLAARCLSADRPWLLRMDVHCRYPRNFVQRLREAATLHAADSVVVPIRSVAESCFHSAIAAAQNSRIGTGGALHRHEGKSQWVDHGHHALFRIERFFEVGGYDESFTHNEDAELDVRLQEAGCTIWLQGDLVVDYIPRSDIVSLSRQYYWYGRGRARNFLLHRRAPKLRQLLPLLVAPAAVLALLTPVNYWAGAPALIWLSVVLFAGLVVGVRNRRWCEAASGFPAALMHLAWSVGFLSQLSTPGLKAAPKARAVSHRAVDLR